MSVCLDPQYDKFFESLRDEQFFFLVQELKLSQAAFVSALATAEATRVGLDITRLTQTARVSVSHFYKMP
jgi:hypothetical protein